MVLEIDTPIILANKQQVKVSAVHIDWDSYVAAIDFSILDEAGNTVKEETIQYMPNEFNEFWQNFNSGGFLYQEYVRKKNITLEVAPKDDEEEFLNPETE